MATLTITLPDESLKYVEEQVAAGRVPDVSAFIQLLIEGHQCELEVDDELLLDIQKGIDELERGEVVSGEEVFAQLEAHAAEIRKRMA